MTDTKYCPSCSAERKPDEQQDGQCAVCGAVLLDERPETTVRIGEATRAVRAPTERHQAQQPGEAIPEERAPRQAEMERAEELAWQAEGALQGKRNRRSKEIRQQEDPGAREEAAREDRAKTEREAMEARERAEREAQERAAREARERAEREAREREEREARQRAKGEAPSEAASNPATDYKTRPTSTVTQHDLEGTQRIETASDEEDEQPRDAETIDYDRLVAQVEQNVRKGYELFGLVGGSASGKTHALKALTYLLKAGGTESERATVEFLKAPTPALTEGNVFHYDYTGNGRRWTFVDAGGELYARLRDNDWKLAKESTRLSRWLDRAHGLFCFLHLRPGHLGGPILDVDPTLEDDEQQRQTMTKERDEAILNQRELSFYRNFFLFLRALRAENGDIAKVIERCRAKSKTTDRNQDSESNPLLEEALHGYHTSAPLLDVPVMFFFTMADRYYQKGWDFAIRDGLYLRPRDLAIPASVFAARYLPTLFDGVASQVRRFKFDFLQSYEEAETSILDDKGNPKIKTYWHAPDDPHQHLSVGLLSGLEFVLRNQPRERRLWELPEITTRQALILHRVLHREQWKGVPRGLLGSWRQPPPRRPDSRPATTPAPETA